MADSDDEFYDCDTGEGQTSTAPVHSKTMASNGSVKPSSAPPIFNRPPTGTPSSTSSSQSSSNAESSVWGGRLSLPAPMYSRGAFSVWTFLKKCIGQELSKITMPVVFNEPLSFLQRVVEYMEYGWLIERASASDDPIERHELVTAFAVSATASNWERLSKPFNPLLGETYELDRPDLGIRIVCEQVSHHPPVSAFHVESELFAFHGSVHPKIKFWGKSVDITPKGLVTLILKRHNEAYSWQNMNCSVHNIIIGKLWIEHYGVMELVNHATKCKAVLNFRPCGWFGRDLHKVDGYLLDRYNTKLRAFYGKWIEALFTYDIEVWEEHRRSSTGNGSGASSIVSRPPKDRTSGDFSPYPVVQLRNQLPKTMSEPAIGAIDDNDSMQDSVPVKGSSCDLNLPGQRLLWVATPKPHNADRYYNFTTFALLLNEIDDCLRSKIPPTDSRLRPDMRTMEEGDFDGAAFEKNRIEELQRAAYKERKKRNDEFTPRWFTLGTNPYTGKEDWLFNGEYWSRDWTRCPQIF